MTLRAVRLQTAKARAKALKQYQELRRTQQIDRAIVIAELANGDIHVLGQDLTPNEMAPLLLVAADVMERADADRKIVKLVAHQKVEHQGAWNQSKPRPKRITTDKDGILIAPPGETFISCGECGHPTWHVLHRSDLDITSRYACAHCGNEVEQIVVHPGGLA